MQALTVGEAAAQTGWSARMLRYLEAPSLVVPERTPSGYRLYGLRELNQLRSLRDLRERFSVELDELALRRAPPPRARTCARRSRRGCTAARRPPTGSTGSSASTSGSSSPDDTYTAPLT